MPMKIDRLILGDYQTNCYILRPAEQSADCLIIDTGTEAEEILDFLKKHRLISVAAVMTHGHIDHIGGMVELRRNFPDLKVYIHKSDAVMLSEPMRNLSAMTGIPYVAQPADFLIEEPFTIDRVGIRFDVIHTAGHTPGGICLYSKDDGVLFSGDTLFAESVGRTDFPGGSMSQLIKNIKTKLLVLPDETVVYPGHGPSTTIGQEKRNNPFLQ